MANGVLIDTTGTLIQTVQTERGMSVLYAGQYLFSRYDPEKTLRTLLDSLTFQSGTLILCFSPVLPFTVELIKKKLASQRADNCFILGIEKDVHLYRLYCKAASTLKKSVLKKTSTSAPPAAVMQKTSGVQGTIGTPKKTAEANVPAAIVLLERAQDTAVLLEKGGFPDNQQNRERYFGDKLPNEGTFRRISVIDGSAGVRLHKDFYDDAADYAQNSINVFWKNRITLVRLGRLFSRNALKNCARAAVSVPLVKQSVCRPILVCGAGTSLNRLIPFIRINRTRLHILAVDAALRSLLDQGIRADAVIAVESQAATSKAFTGTAGTDIPLIADLCSRAQILRITGGSVSFFISEYYANPLLERIKQTLGNLSVLPPLGSVGLVSMEIALLLRAQNVPVFTCGLDFSYPAGMSHCKEAPSQKESHRVSNRFFPAGNPEAAFRNGAFFAKSKSGSDFVCDPALRGYAQLFSARYKNAAQVYDLADEGLDTGLPRLTETQASAMLDTFFCNNGTSTSASPAVEDNKKNAGTGTNKSGTPIDFFYLAEKKRLTDLRGILTGSLPAVSKGELLDRLSECSYLYLHFPDGYKNPKSDKNFLNQSFLNRIRSEIDVFLKDIDMQIEQNKENV